jgi:IS30 family transposase
MNQKKKKKKTTNKFASIYYNINHPAAYGGVDRLHTVTRQNPSEWLQRQLAYTLHKPLKRKFATRKYMTSGINDLWQLDLMEMIPYAKINRGYKYILSCIDVFSRYGRVLPLKSKQGLEVAAAIKKMLQNNVPRHIQTDLGKEFYNTNVKKVFKDHDIGHYSVHSQFKAALVERFNRTLREKLNRYFTHTGKKVWHNVLQSIVTAYNKSGHSSLQNVCPADINFKSEMDIWQKQQQQQPSQKQDDISLLDYVRISRVRGPFIKNFDQNWSDEVFRVIGVDKKQAPTMYILEDLQNNAIHGKFYKPELQSIGANPPDIYRIEKIIKSQGVGKHKQYYVKWVGYDSSHNSWISASNVS